MNIVLFGLLGSLVALTVVYAAFWLNEARKARRAPDGGRPADRVFPGSVELAIGFVTDFFDTLGIGNFATTTAAFKLFRLVPDERIPGTLNVGHTIPVVAEALIYVAIIQVDMTTLVAMIAAAVAGAWLGAGIVARLPRRAIQVGMGIALLIAASLLLLTLFGVLQRLSGDAVMLSGVTLGAAVLGNFALGALMTLGIGLYAPCMILVSLLGMNPTAAFPIMMGSCAFLMPVGSMRFIRLRSLYPARGAGPDDRGHSRRAARRLPRQVPSARIRPLARRRGRRLRGRHDAALRGQGGGRKRNENGERKGNVHSSNRAIVKSFNRAIAESQSKIANR